MLTGLEPSLKALTPQHCSLLCHPQQARGCDTGSGRHEHTRTDNSRLCEFAQHENTTPEG